MLKFRLSVLNSPEVSCDVIAFWEVAAFFKKSALAEDLEIDVDEATDWYIEHVVDEASREDYRSERQTAECEMMESFTQALKKAAQERSTTLREHYPFSVDDTKLQRKELSTLSSAALNYICLQFYRLVKANLVEFEGRNSDELRAANAAFGQKFAKAFENIAAYAVAGHTAGVAFQTSNCRSSNHLHKLLRSICASIGAGKVLPYEHWNDVQRAANDGGVDCLVWVGPREDKGNAYLSLVGASIQEASIDQKIIGSQSLQRFGRFFTEKPAAFQGAFVRPQDEMALIKIKCKENDCLLYSYDEIIEGIGKLEFPMTDLNLKKIGVNSRIILRDFQSMILLESFEEYAII